MTTQTKGPLAGFGWLKRGISMTFRYPRVLLGGAAILFLACLLPAIVTVPFQVSGLQSGASPSPGLFAWITAGSWLLGLLIVPLYAGYLQVIAAADHGSPARARDIVAPYARGDALRLIGYGLAMLAVYAALFGGVIALTGRGLARWYMQVVAAQLNHQPPPTTLPDGFGISLALLMVCGLFLMGVYAISLGQVALRRRSVFGAIGDGFAGALKNLLPLLVFAVVALLTLIVAALCFGILAALLMLLAKLVGTWAMFVVIVPLYIAFVLYMFAIMFGVMYQMWRDVCEGDIAPAVSDAHSVAA